MENGTITGQVIGAAIEVHRGLGPGLLESAYEGCLVYELGRRGLRIERQVALPVRYRGLEVECGYRVDLIVANAVIVELKAVERVQAIHEAQLLTYLRLSGKRVGLILNFNVRRMREGIHRLVHRLPEAPSP